MAESKPVTSREGSHVHRAHKMTQQTSKMQKGHMQTLHGRTWVEKRQNHIVLTKCNRRQGGSRNKVATFHKKLREQTVYGRDFPHLHFASLLHTYGCVRKRLCLKWRLAREADAMSWQARSQRIW